MRLLIIISLTTLIGCTKDNTPQPITNTTDTTTQTNYFTNEFVQDNIVGNYNIYKETHIGNDTVYEYYPTPMIPIYITSNSITYNPPSTPIPYSYNNFNINSSQYNYTVIDMSEDTDWIYMLDHSSSYILGFDSMYISLSRI